MRAGAHLIAGSLSGSLALATGKEPLRSALTTQLRAMLHNRLPGPELEAAIAVSCPFASCPDEYVAPVSGPFACTRMCALLL